MIIEEARPCPFCGSNDLGFTHSEDRRGREFARIGCKSCGADGPPIASSTVPITNPKGTAVSGWNRRP